jgi:deferrochelatase/peroxidase EfeB
MRRKSLRTRAAIAGDGSLALKDIQGLILRGYRHHYVRFFILQIRDVAEGAAPDGAKRNAAAAAPRSAVAGTQTFLKALLPGGGGPLTLTSAEDWGSNRPAYCLNIGLTSSGLKKLVGEDNYNVTNQNTNQDLFGPFDAGAENRAQNVGDIGPSAPQHWWKNGNWRLKTPPPNKNPNKNLDILLALYTNSPGDRDSFAATLLKMIPACGDGLPAAQAAFIQDSDPLLDAQGAPTERIQFGYEDGISQPRIKGAPGEDPNAPDDSHWVDAWRFVIVEQTPVPGYFAAPLLVNGCFGAFRLLYQDVGAFNDFLHQKQVDDPNLLAAKMCGRWFDGSPLEVTPDKPDPSLKDFELTNFNYITPTKHQKLTKEDDTDGHNCPYASHTRRANPRDDNLVQGNFDGDGKPLYAELHRVRRFASSYGPPYTPKTRDAQRGLVGLFMGANLTDQFEFIMGTWFNNGGFRPGYDYSPNQSGIDPFLAAEDTNQYFAYCTADCGSPSATYAQVPNLNSFIRTDGGLYVFLPGFAGLGYIARGELPPS